MKKLLILLISASFLFSWQLKENENGIKVYTQDVKNSKYDEFKAEMTVNKPLKQVEDVLTDFKNYPKWQKKISKIEIKDGYMLKVLDFPFPLSDRFAFYKINVKNKADGIVIEMSSISYDKLPENIKKEFEKPSCVEMKDHVFFTAEKTDGGVKITYEARVDPNGAPAFIFNSKIVSAGYSTLEHLRDLLN